MCTGAAGELVYGPFQVAEALFQLLLTAVHVQVAEDCPRNAGDYHQDACQPGGEKPQHKQYRQKPAHHDKGA